MDTITGNVILLISNLLNTKSIEKLNRIYLLFLRHVLYYPHVAMHNSSTPNGLKNYDEIGRTHNYVLCWHDTQCGHSYNRIQYLCSKFKNISNN